MDGSSNTEMQIAAGSEKENSYEAIEPQRFVGSDGDSPRGGEPVNGVAVEEKQFSPEEETPPAIIVPFDGPSSDDILDPSPLSHSFAVPSPTEKFTEETEQAMVFLPSRPSPEELTNIASTTKGAFVVTGTAATGKIGPVLGLLDIGESEDSYLFRVALPGVKRNERDFSCEVESDGRVLIKGVTCTGEKVLHKYSQVFKMQSQSLCPPGHFSISFTLPGPIDPQQFTGNFGTDGILEGIVMKAGHQNIK